jgi:hypothetical protein
MGKGICLECAYYQGGGARDGLGHCYFNPPIVSANRENEGHSVRPIVSAVDYCALFVAKKHVA